jgi:hypothetical protein
LTGSPIRKGSEVSCGEFLGMIMDFPGSPFDHVHIGVENGSIKQFLNNDGTLKCTTGQDITRINIDPSILGGVSLGGEEESFAGEIPIDNEGDFEFADIKKDVKENIKRIKKML